MSYTASVQRLEPWSPVGVVLDDGQPFLVHDDDQILLDLVGWVSRMAWSTGLMRWEQVTSAHAGCSAAEGGQLVEVAAD